MTTVSDHTAAQTADRLVEAVGAVAAELHPSRRLTAVTLDSSLDRDLGFDSLGRAELIARLEATFDVTLPDTVLATAESPRDLLRAVLGARGRDAAASPVATVAALDRGRADVVPATATTLTEVLDWHADRHPDRPHVRLYADDDDGEVITYRQLQREARRLAAGLSAFDVGPGDAVALMLPTGRDYFVAFFGVLLAGAVPVPIYPPARPTRIGEHVRRHVGILDNCRARLLIGSAEAQPVAALLRAHVESLAATATVSDLLARGATPVRAPAIAPDDIAFLQYTSGSTGNPKGVALSHANLLANIRAMAAALEATPDDTFVSWLPLYHDMGLIGAWLGSLHHATPLVIMSPLAFLAKPARWLRAIHRYRGTISGGPNFAYELCLRRLQDRDLEGLDLGSWRVAFNGAEPVRAETIDAFCDRFAACGLRRDAMLPVYGLAENCVGLAFPPLRREPRIDRIRRDPLATSGRAMPAAAGDEPTLRIVSCGLPLPGHQIRIVDPLGHERPERHEGRLQFCGPSSTSGYFRDPDATRRLFDGGWLDSGDLAYLAEGEVFITGRAKDLIIRAGRNIHPTDLEEAIGAVDGILPGRVAVFGSADPGSGTERLVVVAETRRREPADLQALTAEIDNLSADLVGGPTDVVLLAPPGTIPHTSSGKIRRAACRALWESGRLGSRDEAAWLQAVRLAVSGTLPRVRRAGRMAAAALFGGYAWLVAALLAPFAWLAAVVVPSAPRRWRMVQACARLLARITGTRLAVGGLENLPPAERPCVVVCNHASYLDGFVLVAVLPWPVGFVAKAELAARWPTRLPLRGLGAHFVERFDARKGIEDYRTIADACRRGRTPLFFPEGTFRRMPGLLPFHMGAFALAADAGLPVVPIAIRGTRSILRSGSWFPDRGGVTVTVCPPVPPPADGDRWTAAVRLRDAAREAILRHCGEPDLEREAFLGAPDDADRSPR
ncbi:MAG: AMP-binding protein [Rhodospirillales bacterium]